MAAMMWRHACGIVFFSIAILCVEAGLESSPAKTYCVRPETASEDCPDPCSTPDTCNTLMYYALNETFAASDAMFLFLPGEHKLRREIYVVHVTNVTMKGMEAGDAIISCKGSSSGGGFYFEYVTNLTIEKLKIYECSYCKNNSSLCDAIGMYKITNLSMTSVVISKTKGIGLKLTNLYGNSTISDTTVENSTGVRGQNLALYCYNDKHHDNKSVSKVLIYNSTIQYGNQRYFTTSNGFVHPYAGGLFIQIGCNITMSIILHKVNVLKNEAGGYSSGGNIAIEYISYSQKWLIQISIIECLIAYGYGNIGGGLYFNAFRIPGGKYEDEQLGTAPITNITADAVVPILTVNDTCFTENESIFGAGVYIRFRETQWPEVAKVSFNNCHFSKQKIRESEEPQHGGVAIHIRNLQLPVYVPHKRPLLELEFVNCSFTNNLPMPKASSTSLYAAESHNGALFIQGIDTATFSGCKFVENECSGIVSIQSLLIMRDENIIHNNNGIRGGGMVLCSRSILFLRENSTLDISGNRANKFGGGIYVESECDQDVPYCFFQINTITSFNDTRVSLINNTALAGEAIYGGMVDYCIIYMNIAQNYTKDEASKIFNGTFYIQSNGNSVISSNPYSVCFCCNETFDETACLGNNTINMTIVPGSTIQVYVMLLGQRNNPAPGIVEALASCDKGNCWTSNTIKETEQDTTQCTQVEYKVYSSNEDIPAKMELVVAGGSFEYSGSEKQQYAVVNLTIKKCPLGSKLIPPEGACRSIPNLPNFPHYITTVIVSTAPVWIGYRTMHPLPHTRQIIYHKFCPLGYCSERRRGVNISTTYKSFDQDAQCAKHRTGLLCGECKQNYSLGFGSSQCLAGCSTPHRYLQYLRVIGLSAVCAGAGILLVVLLTLLNLTVAEGTLNGLIFYANIVQVNLDLFFPQTLTPDPGLPSLHG